MAIVVTTIAHPTEALRQLAKRVQENCDELIVIGDETSPKDFFLEGANYYDLRRQEESGSAYAKLCPKRHYARKNIGYILAIQKGASWILETDDDNLPWETFWRPRQRKQVAPVIEEGGWVNVYRYFTSENIWPRGFPLEYIRTNPISWESLKTQTVDCPIQQGLADEHPDVDAIYALAMPLPIFFREDKQIILTQGSWCPFNSQNTAWWPEVYPLLYLPAYCPFRLTDIWRSFVAQRIAWANGWGIMFHGSTVRHARNEHNLLKDFNQEIPGYLNNQAIGKALESLKIEPGLDKLGDNLHRCYEMLIAMSLLDKKELVLLEAFLTDLKLMELPLITQQG